MRQGLAAIDAELDALDTVARKGSHVKNVDEQSVSITGQVPKSESSEEAEPPKSFKGLQN